MLKAQIKKDFDRQYPHLKVDTKQIILQEKLQQHRKQEMLADADMKEGLSLEEQFTRWRRTALKNKLSEERKREEERNLAQMTNKNLRKNWKKKESSKGAKEEADEVDKGQNHFHDLAIPKDILPSQIFT